MGIRKVSESKWRVVARVRLHDGKIGHKQTTLAGTKEQAKALFEQYKSDLRGGAHCSLTSAETFGALMKEYIERRGGISESHRNKCEMLIAELGEIPISGFAEKFDEYLRMKRNSICPTTGRRPSNGTINRRVEIVKAAFRLGVDLGIVAESPISRARFPRLKEIPRDRYLSEHERVRLFNVIEQNERIKHILPIVRYALAVPSRRNELARLKRESLDQINRVIVLRNGTTKNDCGCVKPIPPDQWEYFAHIPRESEYIFYREEAGKYLPLGDFKHAWQTALQLAGIEDFRFHDLRGTSATDLAVNGTDDRALMFIGNWKTRAMLDRYYRKDTRRMLSAVHFQPVCDSVVLASKAAGV